jgi:hypothetical protein
MTNAQASEAPFFGRGTQSFPTTSAPERPGVWHGRRNLVLGLAAVSVAVVTIGGVQYARVSSQTPVVAHASKLAVGVGAAQAYQQAGSVYGEQVPQGAVATDQSALAIGGSVYGEQVPHGVVVAQSALAIGGSVYAEQVPDAATADLSAYSPSGSVYIEQVPSAR